MSWLEIEQLGPGEPGGWTHPSKPEAYLPIYERHLGHLRGQRFALLELGVAGGSSLGMWAKAFPEATIVGVDLDPPELDLGERVHMVRGDQADPELLAEVGRRYAPEGFAVIIDDASHLGIPTARSLESLFNGHLRPAGLYMIEDWGTGYVGTFPDGAAETRGRRFAQRLSDNVRRRRRGVRFPSHDYGMVGLVKRLVDHAGGGFAAPGWSHLGSDTRLRVQRLCIEDGMVVLYKEDGGETDR